MRAVECHRRSRTRGVGVLEAGDIRSAAWDLAGREVPEVYGGAAVDDQSVATGAALDSILCRVVEDPIIPRHIVQVRRDEGRRGARTRYGLDGAAASRALRLDGQV